MQNHYPRFRGAPSGHFRMLTKRPPSVDSGLGRVRADLNGESEIIICVFGEPDGPSVIGALTLEVFLLGVNPVDQRLVPVEGYQL